MIAERLAALHARAMTVPGPWTARDFTDLLSGKGVFLVSSSLQKYDAERAKGAMPLSLTATPEAAQDLTCFALGRILLDEAEVLTLAVDPTHHRQGLGSACLKAFETEAAKRGASQLFLEVAETNAPARALYASGGWQESGRRKAYYKGDQTRIDAILMTKWLGAD